MSRKHKDANWVVNVVNGSANCDNAQLSVLMDIRDELKENNAQLKKINNYLGCQNIQKLFKTVERLDKRLAKKLPLKY